MILLPFVAGVVAVSGCSRQRLADTVSGVNLANLDLSVSPKTDFYQYACGGWMKANPLKPEYGRYCVFDRLREDNQEQIRSLIDELGSGTNEKGSMAQKIGDLYTLGLDSVRLNREGANPLSSDLSAIREATGKEDFSRLIARLLKAGISTFFQIGVDADAMNSSRNLFLFYQGGMNMGDRDYYLQDDGPTVNIREAYRNYVKRLFERVGYEPDGAKKAADTVLDIETRLARSAFSREELRNPRGNYNKLTVDEFSAQVKGLDWKVFFSELGLDSLEYVNPMQLPFMKAMGDLVEHLLPEEMKLYLTYQLLDGASPYLSDDFVAENFDFYGKVLSGKQEQQPRWKRSLDAVNGALSEAVGQLYVARYFPPEAKERMLKLVENLRLSLGQRIDALSWMSDGTKAKAREKLAAFHVKIGYPDRWRDYAGLSIDPQRSYWENIKASSAFELDYALSEVNRPVDRDKWYMSPQTVNAYYNPATNEICFPAGILQPPFFDLQADDATNYGAIGVVIGHEMTHGFDDQGRQYDKDGNLEEWWTADDAAKFGELAQKLVDQYDQIIVLDTVHANGRFTLGENIADQGGLQVAFQAFTNTLGTSDEDRSTDEFTPQQRFFLSYAGLWAGNERDEEILRRTKTDPHSLGKWRVNGALPNVGAFYEAFDIQEGDSMYLAPRSRVEIW